MLCSRGSHEGIRNDLDQSVNGATAQSPIAGQRLVFSPPLEGWRGIAAQHCLLCAKRYLSSI